MRNVLAAAAGVAVGIWLMAAPAVFGYTGTTATIDRIVGPTAAAAAWIAAAEVTRSIRWVNVGLGGWLVVSAVLLDRTAGEALNAAAGGVLLILAALVMTALRQDRLSGGWKSLFGL